MGFVSGKIYQNPPWIISAPLHGGKASSWIQSNTQPHQCLQLKVWVLSSPLLLKLALWIGSYLDNMPNGDPNLIPHQTGSFQMASQSQNGERYSYLPGCLLSLCIFTTNIQNADTYWLWLLWLKFLPYLGECHTKILGVTKLCHDCQSIKIGKVQISDDTQVLSASFWNACFSNNK